MSLASRLAQHQGLSPKVVLLICGSLLSSQSSIFGMTAAVAIPGLPVHPGLLELYSPDPGHPVYWAGSCTKHSNPLSPSGACRPGRGSCLTSGVISAQHFSLALESGSAGRALCRPSRLRLYPSRSKLGFTPGRALSGSVGTPLR